MRFITTILFLLFGVTATTAASVGDTFYPMRVINHATMMRNPLLAAQSPLKAKVAPVNFSGPAIFKHLLGRCFSLSDGQYRYELCPFQNITQHDESIAWNAYRGVIGTFHEWLIEKDRFVGMVMGHGDSCSAGKERQAHVFIECGSHHAVTSVKETITCFYTVNFTSPLACDPDSTLIYPLINADLREQWDRLASLRHQEVLTEKGYRKAMEKLFTAAGLLKTLSQSGDEFSPACMEAIIGLKKNVRALRLENLELRRRLREADGRASKP